MPGNRSRSIKIFIKMSKKKATVIYMFVCSFLAVSYACRGQDSSPLQWNQLPVKALLLTVPNPEDVPLLCDFIRDALPKEGVNTLILRIRYKYQFKTHPELADEYALSEPELKQIVKACREAGIRFIPKMNLLGHQSEKTRILPLLARYPQFDESPDLNPPVPWEPVKSPHDFYCKSLCPLHPGLPEVIFPLMDELIDVCQADAFHVGLDEVWILGYDKCPRCGGRDKSEIFAEYATKLHHHLKEMGCETWIWSDRLLDGKTTNLLAWQASMNDTHRAIDRVPKDIVICDWKYYDAPPTPAYFAVKGFPVLAATSSRADVALAHLEQIYLVRKNARRSSYSVTISERMRGVLVTMWGDTKDFIRAYYNAGENAERREQGSTRTFKRLFAEIRKNEQNPEGQRLQE